VAAVISSPDHPVWQWLAKRSGRVAGLTIELRLEDDDATQYADQLSDWVQPLRTLSSIPCVQLKVEWIGEIGDVDHPCIALWLKQHGQLISQLTVEVHISEDMLKLRQFSEAAAPCRSIDLTIRHSPYQPVDLANLDLLAGSLCTLKCEPSQVNDIGSLRGTSALKSMSQLTVLALTNEDLGSEEPWGILAKLTSLQQLILAVIATGDPSPLSALTGLTHLKLHSFELDAEAQPPFSLSSLQPFNTLQQLEELHLGYACAATSLQGLAGLSNLKRLGLKFADKLSSLEGICPGLTDFSIRYAPYLVNMGGMEGCTCMESLTLQDCPISSLQPLKGLSSLKQLELSMIGTITCLEGLNSRSLQSLRLTRCHSLTHLPGVEHFSALKSLEMELCDLTSLQPLSQLGEGLQKLRVIGCSRVQEEVLELPHVQPTADVVVQSSNVKEVVLARGVRFPCIS
jgi:Leucine-rich repeat (LRR) protein